MSDKKTVIALGYFDSVHLGHRSVMNSAKQYAKEHDASLVVFTFGGNLKGAVLGNQEKSVYTPFERENIIKELGAVQVFFAPVTKDFLSLSAKQFLDLLNEKYQIIAYVSGGDYKFGNKGSGDVEFLKAYALEKSQVYICAKTQDYKGQKISTTRIKQCLSTGEINDANIMLGRAYSITGKVFEDRKVGHKLGFPTVNVKLDKDKFRLLDGVYKGRVFLCGKEYKTIINYGSRPTFDLDDKLVEAHILGFSGDLYGRQITLFFDAFMRKVKKFESVEHLKNQLELDLKNVKEGKYD